VILHFHQLHLDDLYANTVTFGLHEFLHALANDVSVVHQGRILRAIWCLVWKLGANLLQHFEPDVLNELLQVIYCEMGLWSVANIVIKDSRDVHWGTEKVWHRQVFKLECLNGGVNLEGLSAARLIEREPSRLVSLKDDFAKCSPHSTLSHLEIVRDILKVTWEKE